MTRCKKVKSVKHRWKSLRGPGDPPKEQCKRCLLVRVCTVDARGDLVWQYLGVPSNAQVAGLKGAGDE